MEAPAGRLRQAVEEFAHEQAHERLRRHRGAADALSEVAVADRHPWLTGEGALAALGDAGVGMLSEPERGALRGHVARARADAVLAEARDGLASRRGGTGDPSSVLVRLLSSSPGSSRRDLAQELAAAAAGLLPGLLGARARADAQGLAALAGGPLPPDVGPSPTDLAGLAERLLTETAALAQEAVDLVFRRADSPPRTWEELAAALRDDRLDGLWPREGRWRRLAEGLGGLGLGPQMSERLGVEADHGGLDPRVRVAALRVPQRVRLSPSPVEIGLGSELAACDGLGRGLALALTSPALSVELRRPVIGSVGRGLGTLLAQLLGDRLFLSRRSELTRAEVEDRSRRAATLLVLETRLHAAAYGARASAAGAAERAELGAEALGRALGVPMPAPLAELVVATPAALGPRLRGRLGGLALAGALRERYDEDWFRNPRAAEPLRGACARGGSLSVEALCDELGASPTAAAGRLHELFG